jgi:hypothetical protein
MKKIEKYAILYLALSGKEAEQISKELKLPIKAVQKIVEETQKVVETVVAEKDNPTNLNKPDKFMIKQSVAGKDRGVAVMTQQASMLGDALMKNIDRTSNRSTDHIFRPKG